ncbi:MAG TPA: HEAT repeat domain-containing protein [Bryobacteraceae bacterium]|nr:HEAT repeat domain-containing protein [Bryobacteraceae bacterium]
MTRGAWIVLAAALPLAAQPKLLVNAKLDTRSAAQGLDREFQALLAATPQPAWIAYSVPSNHTAALGCEFVSRDGAWWSSGTVHLEPPSRALILFRVVAAAVERIRALSPDCEIDAGGTPFHWIADVAPAESVTLLAALATREPPLASAVGAIAVHGDPAADRALDRFAAAGQPDALRQRAIACLGSARGRHGFEALKGLVENDSAGRIRTRAIAALGSSQEPEAVDLLISLSQTGPDARARAQAVRELGHKRGAKAVAAIGAALADADAGVQQAACAALGSLPDGQGIPRLIQLAGETRDRQLRRQAMSSLQDSHDPRALAFFERVLTN